MTIQDIKDLATTNNLEVAIKELLLSNLSTEIDIEGFFTDVELNGCNNGLLSELQTYEDVLSFHNKHIQDLKTIVDEFSKYSNQEIPEDEFLLTCFIVEETCKSIQKVA